MRFVKLLLSFYVAFCSSIAIGALTDFDRQEISYENILAPWNAGFESGTAQISYTGVAPVAVSSGSNLLKGKGSITWDSTSAGQTLTSKAVTVPNWLKGENCEVALRILVPSGTGTHTLGVWDGTTLINPTTITSSPSSTTSVVTSVSAPCGTGTIAWRLTSVASNEPLIAIDEGYIGKLRNVGQVNNFTSRQTYTPTLGSGYGTATNNTAYWYRNGDRLILYGSFTTGTVAAAQGGISLPSAAGCTVASSEFLAGEITAQISTTAGTHNAAKLVYSASLGLLPSNVSTGGVTNHYGGITINSIMNGSTNQYWWANVPCSNWQVEQAFRPEMVAWRVDANISGANPDLGTVDVTTYTTVENSSLTLTNNSGTGTIAAQIPCSGGNAPSGTTCSAGNEQVGVAFAIPAKSDAIACASFTHLTDVGGGASTGGVYTTFQIVETSTTTETIVQSGKSRIGSANEVASVNGRQLDGNAVRVCGTFSFSSAGTKVLRLQYEQDVTGTVSNSQIYGDASGVLGDRDIHWEVYPINQHVPAPLLVNSVTSNFTGLTRTEYARVAPTNGSTCTIQSQSGTWLTATTPIAAGRCTLTIASGFFSSTPICVATPTANGYTGVTQQVTAHFSALSTTSMTLETRYDVGAANAITADDQPVNITCFGAR